MSPATNTASGSLLQTLSVAAPAYNEAEGIAQIVSRWREVLHEHHSLQAFELVICNDGSKDKTGEVLRNLSARIPELRVVEHAVNRGAGAALTTAIQATRFDWVFLIDSDGQFPIEALPAFAEQIARGAVAVIGVRTAKHDSLFARFGSWSSGRLCNWFHGTDYRDFNCALKLVRGDLLRSLHLEAAGLNYSAEVTSKLLERGVVLAEVEVEHLSRQHGTSSMRMIRGAFHRALFVSYIGLRQFLLRNKILQRVS